MKKFKDYDFGGWATKNNLKCTDGRTIIGGAFKHHDGQTVPLVWNHQHNDINNILGNAELENRNEGIYAYCKFNETEAGKNARLMVQHGDVRSLSIFANQLRQQGGNVVHGDIKEVSLVLAGANPGAFIDTVISHSDDDNGDEEAIIYTNEDISLYHSEEMEEESKDTEIKKKKEDDNMAEKTIKDVFDTLNEEQKNVVYFMIGKILEDAKNGDIDVDEESEMKHNIFDNDYDNNVLSHADMEMVIKDARRMGRMKDAVIANGLEDRFIAHAGTYGIDNADYLFPDAKMIGDPEFISRDMSWVSSIINGAKHLPFSRVKSMAANITADEARARGYIKGNEKHSEVFPLLKRVTNPTTIYKKQKMDRDDVVDISDFDVISWLKREMRLMLDEEIARAALIGDGRVPGTEDKISEDCIRPIWTDADLYTIKKEVKYSSPTATESEKANEFIKTVLRSRKEYKGTGNPTLYTTEDILNECLLMEDTTGRRIYDTMEKLKTAMRVSDIITVPVMEGQKREHGGKTYGLLGILVNMGDYSFGADKGGAVNMFDDFDIDFNQEKYLIETRCSGALTKPYSAVAIETVVSNG